MSTGVFRRYYIAPPPAQPAQLGVMTVAYYPGLATETDEAPHHMVAIETDDALHNMVATETDVAFDCPPVLVPPLSRTATLPASSLEARTAIC